MIGTYLNDYSLLFKMTYGDVLKVGHHGSYNSITAEFLYDVQAQFVVISCEYENEYGYPHDIVLNRLAMAGYGQPQIYRTDLDGDVIMSTKGEGIQGLLRTNDTGK